MPLSDVFGITRAELARKFDDEHFQFGRVAGLLDETGDAEFLRFRHVLGRRRARENNDRKLFKLRFATEPLEELHA